jgi:hypothetical protein
MTGTSITFADGVIAVVVQDRDRIDIRIFNPTTADGLQITPASAALSLSIPEAEDLAHVLNDAINHALAWTQHNDEAKQLLATIDWPQVDD